MMQLLVADTSRHDVKWWHHIARLGTGRPLTCICLYIYCQFSLVTSPPRDRITEPPLHEPNLQHSSSDSPLTKPYKNPLANKSPAPVASTAFVSPIAGTLTILNPTIMLLPKESIIVGD